jgi:TPR repeat protein
LAADQGEAAAQADLGTSYLNGEGVVQDYAEAVKWFWLAADQGYALAQGKIGLMYARGLGAPKDYVLAYMWLNLAAAKGGPGEPDVSKSREEILGHMNSSQVQEAQHLSREWKPPSGSSVPR